MPDNFQELEQKFKELMKDEPSLQTFIRPYAPELPQILQQRNVMRGVPPEPLAELLWQKVKEVNAANEFEQDKKLKKKRNDQITVLANAIQVIRELSASANGA